MAVQVKAPNGDVVEFPDGTPDETINAEMDKAYKAGQFGPAERVIASSPDNSVTISVEDDKPPVQKPVSEVKGFERGAMRPLDNSAMWLEQGLKHFGVPVDKINEAWATLGDKTGSPLLGAGMRGPDGKAMGAAQLRDARERAFQEGDTRPGTMGDIAGSTASTLTMTGVKGPVMLLGALGGALNTDHPESVGKTLTDAGIGAVLGKGADIGTRALGATISPVVRDNVKRFLKAGIPLTPGQILGGGAQRVEDAVASVPFVGDLVNAAQGRANEAANREAANNALKHVGMKIDGNLVGHEMAQAVQKKLGDMYDSLVPSLSAVTDGQFFTDFTDLLGKAKADLGANEFGHFKQAMDRVRQAFKPHPTGSPLPTVPGGLKGGHIAQGEDFKNLESFLSQRVRGIRGNHNSTVYDHDLADYLDQTRELLRNTLARQNPAAAKSLRSLNSAYRDFVPVEEAIGSAKTGEQGIFSGTGLGTAANKGVGRRVKAAGGSAQRQFGEDMQQVMGHKVGDSGTATRGLVTYLGGMALSSKLPAAFALNPWALAAIAALGGAYTKGGGKIARAVLASRPAGAAAVRKAVDAAARPVAVAASVSRHAGNPRDLPPPPPKPQITPGVTTRRRGDI